MKSVNSMRFIILCAVFSFLFNFFLAFLQSRDIVVKFGNETITFLFTKIMMPFLMAGFVEMILIKIKKTNPENVK